MEKKFKSVRMEETSKKYKAATKRLYKLYDRDDDIRTEFARDYTRIIHCFGFRRLKHKTQVFFAPYNDHICTRLEHSLHVTSISQTISKELGLNTELVTCIAIGHDLGHAPFGHRGEEVLNEIWIENIINKGGNDKKKKYFWHEKHGLKVVDYFETVKDDEGYQQNLNLTYATRDGIICHCGEGTFQNPIKPRNENILLSEISESGKFQPFTWEGCVVKISDLISYLGRDLEDAETSKLIENGELDKLKGQINIKTKELKIKDMCNSAIIHSLITDLCKNSSPVDGLTFSDDGKELISQVHKFNYEKIYYSHKLTPYKKYIKLILKTIFEKLMEQYDGDIYKTLKKIKNREETVFRVFMERWLERYHKDLVNPYEYVSESNLTRKELKKYYDIKSKEEYCEAVIDYIAGFTDNFAISCFNEIISVI